MSKQLPARPSLEQLKKQAKDLRQAHQHGDPEAARRIREYLPRLSKAAEEEILKADFSLQEAQHVLAREYGCRHWEMLGAVVEADFAVLAHLRDRDAQVLLREVEQKDLVIALKGAPEAVQTKFLSHMSARVSSFIRSELELLNDLGQEEVAMVRRRILQQTAELAAKDLLNWPGSNQGVTVQGEEPPFQPSGRLVKLVRHPLDQLTVTDLAELCQGLANQACREGILSVESLVEQVESPFLREALNLAVDGTEPELIRDLLMKRSQYGILRQLDTRGHLIIEGLLAIRAGDHPLIIRHKVDALFQAQPTGGDSGPRAVTAEELKQRLRATPLEQMRFDQLAELFVDMGFLARKESIAGLEPLKEALKGQYDLAAELLRRGLELVLDRTSPDQLVNALETQLKTRLAGIEKNHRRVIAGTMAVQKGLTPGEVEQAVREAAA